MIRFFDRKLKVTDLKFNQSLNSTYDHHRDADVKVLFPIWRLEFMQHYVNAASLPNQLLPQIKPQIRLHSLAEMLSEKLKQKTKSDDVPHSDEFPANTSLALITMKLHWASVHSTYWANQRPMSRTLSHLIWIWKLPWALAVAELVNCFTTRLESTLLLLKLESYLQKYENTCKHLWTMQRWSQRSQRAHI